MQPECRQSSIRTGSSLFVTYHDASEMIIPRVPHIARATTNDQRNIFVVNFLVRPLAALVNIRGLNPFDMGAQHGRKLFVATGNQI
ncbi:hypothetical protein LUTEI9C_80338 [Luteimonas sp. 9C]|nr:hypothetical protein LUTEI9C_80338 [Luteimonas sp. 9C]